MPQCPCLYGCGACNRFQTFALRHQREIDLLAGISHPNVLKLYEIYDEPRKLHLVMELVYGGELFDQIVVSSVTLTRAL